MASEADLARYRDNLQTERDAVSLYMSLAKAEHNEALASLFRQMAETEQGHAAFWEAKLREAGADVPRYCAELAHPHPRLDGDAVRAILRAADDRRVGKQHRIAV